MAHGGLIERYGPLLEIDGKEAPVSLHEGSTPLIEVPRLAAWAAPGARLFLKYEGLNPTGSFKDRGMVTAVTHARAGGAESVVCASTGNTAASAAAYAAEAAVLPVLA
ncbi:pyridoxal-phosphate dependent enzyme, partial [bacterium]